ncbi:MAG: cyclophilin-like fold protein [Peptococcaceae bacterium]|nr:cyclophilin-like fold protein [Peptococcaceae bacterium]
MKKQLSLVLILCGLLVLAACGNSTQVQSQQSADGADASSAPVAAPEGQRIHVSVGGRDFTATLEDNDATSALVALLADGAIGIDMRDYSGFEKVGDLPQALPADDAQTNTQPGDLVLYQGDQLVAFYGDHAWSYTRIGHIDNLDGWREALGSGDVTMVLSPAQ